MELIVRIKKIIEEKVFPNDNIVIIVEINIIIRIILKIHFINYQMDLKMKDALIIFFWQMLLFPVKIQKN